MAKKTVTNGKAKPTNLNKENPAAGEISDGAGDTEKLDMTGKRAVFVHVEKLQPATVIVDDTDNWREDAREAYRKLRNFISTKNQWTVRDVSEGHEGPATEAGPDKDIEVNV